MVIVMPDAVCGGFFFQFRSGSMNSNCRAGSSGSGSKAAAAAAASRRTNATGRIFVLLLASSPNHALGVSDESKPNTCSNAQAKSAFV
jgi:hypothetical protein